MDITSIESTNVDHRVLHPGNGRFVGWIVEIRSMHSPEVKKAMKSITGARSKLIAKGKNFSADEIEGNRVAVLSAAIAGWRWVVDEDGEDAIASLKIAAERAGKPADAGAIEAIAKAHTGNWGGEQLAYTAANVRKVLTDPRADWFADDIDEALGVERDFFKS